MRGATRQAAGELARTPRPGDEHVKVMWSGYANQWCVTSRKPRDGGGSIPDNKAVDHDNKAVDRPAPDLKPKPKDRAAPAVPAKIRALPFKAFDEATLRPRAFLYGKHSSAARRRRRSAATAPANRPWPSPRPSYWPPAAACSVSRRRSGAASGCAMPTMTATRSGDVSLPAAGCTTCR